MFLNLLVVARPRCNGVGALFIYSTALATLLYSPQVAALYLW
jgi:hypothetical protein